MVAYTSASTNTGSRWTINGPASPTLLSYTSRYTITATTQTTNFASAYSIPTTSNASSLAAGNIAIIQGIIKPSASGTVVIRFASEVSGSAITAKSRQHFGMVVKFNSRAKCNDGAVLQNNYCAFVASHSCTGESTLSHCWMMNGVSIAGISCSV